VLIAASADAVFDAWLDPKLARRFLAAGDMTVSELVLDAREGGAFRIVMRGEQKTHVHHGRYVLIDRPRRLVFTWISEGTDSHLSLVTVNFAAEAGGVRVTVDHEGLPDSERAESHRRGWRSILEKSARLLVSLTEGIDDHG
jgi:uncharacterized protein YndB with AHSA1/START domain